MATDILIDLGSPWGHVVPLSVLEQITHIEFLGDGHIEVTCETASEDGRIRSFKFKSRKAFDDETGEEEKRRLLGFSNGLIQRTDVEKIIETMSAQTGVAFDEVLENPVYDISFLRRIWATHMGEPFFRFVLQFDPETQQVLVQEDHNDTFELGVLPGWTDPDIIKDMNEDERALLFAYEVIYQMAEPILPEPGEGAFSDPMANVPVMGVRGMQTQQIDLAETTPDQVVATTGGKE